MTATIEELIDNDDWVAARRAIRAELKSDPSNHWLLTRLSLTYYEQRKYDIALRYAKQAAEFAPACPLVQWDLAGALQMLGHHRAAVSVYRLIVKRGVARISRDPCGEGRARARGLIADCHLRMSDSLEALGDREGSSKEFEQHLDLRGPGCHSIYKLGVDVTRPKTARSSKRGGSAKRRARPN